ncbi:hypothetical protein ACJMK2_036514, partial [Sinanodonta woodiana]
HILCIISLSRYFVIKDGWLFYYAETEKKDIGKRRFFNTHPKSAVPLGECIVQACKEQGQPFAFSVESEEVEGRLILAADTEFERDKWIEMMDKSKRVTWANAHIADDLIRQLEEHGLQMAKQKQHYFDRLQSEVLELADEREKTWELERLNEELAKEKTKMETFAEEMKEEFERVKSELDETQNFMSVLEAERFELAEQLNGQKSNLKSLSAEKERVMGMLKRQESMTEQLSQEKENLSHTEKEIKAQLREIEQRMLAIEEEKHLAEERLKDNEEKASILQEEKSLFSEQATELQNTIKDLIAQKEMTEAELKQEIMARIDAERRLKEAEISLGKLSDAVENETPNIQQDVKDEMVVNVKKLKEFFENLAEEAKFDADKPVVMKNAIHARKTMMKRAKTQKFERRRSSSMRGRSLNLENVTMDMGNINPRRAKSTFIRTTSREDGSNEHSRLAPLKEVFAEHL